MISRAISRFIRVSPRKVRPVLDVIRGKNVEQAFGILDSINKGSAFYIIQVLKSALDSAVKKTKGTADASNLFISKTTADAGPVLKRHRAGSMGRAMPIIKRTSHICIELDAKHHPESKIHKTETAKDKKIKEKKVVISKEKAKSTEHKHTRGHK